MVRDKYHVAKHTIKAFVSFVFYIGVLCRQKSTETDFKCWSKYYVIKLAPPTSVPNDDTVGKEEWWGENVSKSDYVILECSLIRKACTICAT